MNYTGSSTQLAFRIEKEIIDFLRFPSSEVLPSAHERTKRDNELIKALLLGNNYRTKVRIFFEDDEDLKVVETTIWGVSDNDVLLKGDLVIPKRRIIEIQTI